MKEKRPPVKMYFPNSVLLQSLVGGGGGCKQSEVTIFSRILRHPDFVPALMSSVVGGLRWLWWGEVEGGGGGAATIWLVGFLLLCLWRFGPLSS